jgi:hypothetical protein
MRAGAMLSAALMLLAAACAQTGTWQNPDVPEEQWSADQADCRARASVEAERDFALRPRMGGSLNYDPSATWTTDMNRFSAQQREQQLFERCMTQRGYRLVALDSAADE